MASAGGTDVTASISSAPSAGGSSASPWVCPACTYENAAPLTCCEACENPNPATHWACVCSSILPLSAKACALCGSPNKHAGWACPSCTLHNSPEHAACVVCDAANPDAPALVHWDSEFESEGGGGGGGGGGGSGQAWGDDGWGAGEEESAAAAQEGAAQPGAYDFGAVTPSLFPALGASGSGSGSGERSPTSLARLLDPVLAPLDIELLGAVGADPLTSSIIFQRQLGWSSIRHARYTPPPALVASYCAAMEEEACELCPELAASNECIARGSSADSSSSSRGGSAAPAAAAAAAAAIAKEISMLQANTSNSVWGSCIMVRADEANLCALKAAITGADSTPYANAFLMFDLHAPPDFPQVPPRVLITTTHGGSVRFNPNLYAEGKVCLSLLGTWAGPGWLPGTSTLYQVLLSIQSLILTRWPLANEPGYEPPPLHAGVQARSQHMLKALVYNMEVRLATLCHGMLGHLRGAPNPFFQAAIAAHFAHKRCEIAAQCVLWCEEAVLLARFAFAVDKVRHLREQQVAASSSSSSSKSSRHIAKHGIKKPPTPGATAAASRDGQPPHPGAAILRSQQAAPKGTFSHCDMCGGSFRLIYGAYGYRDASSGKFSYGACSADPAHVPESPNTQWCTAACEERYGAMVGGAAALAAAVAAGAPSPAAAAAATAAAAAAAAAAPFTAPALVDLAARAVECLRRSYPVFQASGTVPDSGLHPGGLAFKSKPKASWMGLRTEQDLAGLLAGLRVRVRGLLGREGGGGGGGGGGEGGAAEAGREGGGPLAGGEDAAAQAASLGRSTGVDAMFPFYLAWSMLKASDELVEALEALPPVALAPGEGSAGGAAQ